MALGINIRADLSGVQRAMFALHADQVPFAAAMALTSLARGAAGEENREVEQTFNSPTNFTKSAFVGKPATKRSLVSRVQAKDIAAHYLEPYVDGGKRSLWSSKGEKKAMLVPRHTAVNQYGNLARNQLKRLEARPDVFTGRIQFKKTGEVVAGVFQRNETARGPRYKGGGEYGTRGNNRKMIGGVRTTLTLLVQFEDTTVAPDHLPFEEKVRAFVKAKAQPEFAKALRKALATAR